MSWLNLLQQIEWREPAWLLLALQPLLIFIIRFLIRRGNQQQFADKQLLPWVTRQRYLHWWSQIFSKNSAYLLGWCLIAIAAAGPRVAKEIVGSEQLQQVNLMLVVDLSRSMHATDIQPSRLRRCQLEIAELLQRLPNSVSVGMLVFSARPHLYVPYTTDRNAFMHYLSLIDEITPATSGSNLDAALQRAIEEKQYGKGPAAVVLFTDGDIDSQSSRSEFQQRVISEYKSREIPLFILGMGSIEGEAIPLPNNRWLEQDGSIVISKMNEQLLQSLASSTTGKYSPAYDDDSDWNRLYDAGLTDHLLIGTGQRAEHNVIWTELYGWALAPAIILLWLAILPFSLTKGLQLSLLLFSLAIISGITPFRSVYAADQEQNAYQLYRASHYDNALSVYKTIPGYRGRMGEGACLYMLKQYSTAIQQFTQAVIFATDQNSRARALFNLANSYFQTGDYANAITSYRDALLYQPDYPEASYNLEFSQALKQQVDATLRDIGTTQRMGKGPRQARAAESLDISKSGSISIDESSNSPTENQLPPLPGVSTQLSQQLIQQGLQHIQLADDQAGQSTDASVPSQQRYLVDRFSSKTLLTDNPAFLWQRLFEIEEGFPAPVIEPKSVPGVQPW